MFILGDPCSIKQGLDEHLFLQRRFRREVFALIRNRKAPSWNHFQDGASLLDALVSCYNLHKLDSAEVFSV